MKKLLLFTYLTALCFCHTLEAQVAPSIEWQKCFGGSNNDEAFSIQQAIDGGFIVAGGSSSNNGDVTGNHGYEDCWVVRLDLSGNIQWQKSLGGYINEWASSIQQTSDKGFLVAGSTFSVDGDVSGNHGSFDYWVVKLDSSGNIQWQKCLGGTFDEIVTSIQQTYDGGFVVSGRSDSNDGDVSDNHGSEDYWIVKLDSSGNIQWQKSLGGSNGDEANSIQQTSDGGFIVAGNSLSNDGDVSGNHGLFDYWIVKLDSSGNIQWQKSMGGSNDDWAYSIQQTTDGGFIVAGYTTSDDGEVTGWHEGYDDISFPTSDCWIVKLDSLGDIQWEKSLGGSDYDWGLSILQTSYDEFIVAGFAASNNGDVSGNHGFDDYWMVKLDALGNIQWQQCFGGSDVDDATSIQQTADGGFVVAGYTDSNDGDVSGNHGTSDYWIIKFECEQHVFYMDGDSDGFGSLSDTVQSCLAPYGYVTNHLDCNDTVSTISPGANEICNAIDDNCNGLIDADDSLLSDGQIFYSDNDSDSFGSNNEIIACVQPLNASTNNLDCDDTNPSVHPGAPEIPNNAIDDNCNGVIDETCSSDFILVADSLILHHYWLLNNATGVPPINYLWSWGDGTTDTDAYPSHTYDTAGFYNICLTIVDSTGCTDSSCVGYDLQKSEEMLTIITVDVVDSIPDIATGITSTNVLQSLSVYPNPASGNVFVKYSLSTPASVSIKVFDVLGSKLQQLVNDDQEAGAFHSAIDIRNLSNGIYYLQIQAGDQMVSQKIVVMN